MKHYLEIAAAGAIIGIIGLALFIPMHPDQWMTAPAVLFGWLIGVFHGICGEMQARKRRITACRRPAPSATPRARAWWQFPFARP